MPDVFDKYTNIKSISKPIIYAYSDIRFPGCLKIGYTARPIDVRMHEHYPTITPSISYKVEYIESALYSDGTVFTDHDVHKVLKAKRIPCVAGEWYKCTVKDVKASVLAVKKHNLNLENRTLTFKMRPEQLEAVNKTKDYFIREKRTNPKSIPKFLWNAKMRFGKTFTAYQLAKSMNFTRILVLTFKPAVESSWEEDLMAHVDFDGWQFYSKEIENKNGIAPQNLDKNKPIVCFGSFQDFLGTNDNGGIKSKNEWVHTIHWDMVIFDEYHFGAWRENAKNLFLMDNEDSYDSLDIEKYKKEEADNAYNESFLPITTSHYLFLSGTPFRALNSGEFIEEQIFNWTYSDEQKAKKDWNSNEPNPYLSLPRMILMTYKMPDDIKRVALNEQFNEFDLNVFFSAKSATNKYEDSEFVYKDYVQKWLDLIRGAHLSSSLDNLKLGQKPVMPYSDVRMLSILNHTLWFLPDVKSCYAMANLLKERQNVFYHDYTINICAGTKAGIGLDALIPVQKSMENPLESKTITLSCGKLTTGVTVKPWTGIFMLRNLSSPETYFQAAFRVQSPWTIKNESNKEEILKENCYIFDFSLDRALRQVSDYSCRLNVNESNPEKKVGDFINFLPVLAYDGSAMHEVSATDILDMTTSGTSATLLARRWQSALLVNVDNLTLQKIIDNPKAMDALMKIEGFRTLNDDIKTIINKSNAVKKAKSSKGKLTPKEKRELTQEEKEYKSKRKLIQEKLIKFATRIPIFMYLTDYREHCLKDVITQLEPGLFKKVTGLTIEDFELLISIGVFNDSIMNEAVYKFKRYEDSSLDYSGLSKHNEEKVGLFSTVISKEEYDIMADEQKSSMYVVSNTHKSNNTPHVKNLSVNPEKKELINKPINKESFNTQPLPNKSTISKKKKIKINIGTKVIHKKFGVGFIRFIEGNLFEVEFDEGIKKFKNPDAFNMKFLEIIVEEKYA